MYFHANFGYSTPALTPVDGDVRAKTSLSRALVLGKCF